MRGAADIATGGLAEKRGSTDKVRQFGAMLVHDHTTVRQQGRDLAAKLHVTPTPPKDDQGAKDHAAAMKRLQALKGPEFDRAFLEHEVAFHQAVIDAMKTTLAPAFEAHMMAAQRMLDESAPSHSH